MMMNLPGKRYEAVFDTVRDPLLLVDVEGHVHQANAPAQMSLDLGTSDDVTGIVSLERAFQFDGDLMLTLVQRSKPVYGFRLKDAEGNASDVIVDVLHLPERKAKAQLRLVHIKDFTILKNYERWKDELISTVAHEIKNPLTAMKNSMGILVSQASGPVTEKQNKLLTTSIRGIDRLTRLLDGFLDVSRIGAGNYTVDPTSMPAKEFVGDVIDSFQTLFNVQRRILEFDIAKDIEDIYVDAAKLEQVLINLLSNALKFTPMGGQIRVSVSRASLEALPDDYRILPWADISPLSFIRLVVRDTGIGMTDDTLSHLFTRYYGKVDSGGHAGGLLSGSHLGLNISKKLTEVQNGTLLIESEPGVGTAVTVYLPGDKQTFDMLRRLKSFERCLATVADTRQKASVYALRKYESKQWGEIVERWEQNLLVNPELDAEKQSSCFLWTLGADIAIVLVDDEESLPALASLAEVTSVDESNCGTSADGYMAGCARLPEDAARPMQLIRTAITRMKQAPSVLTKS